MGPDPTTRPIELPVTEVPRVCGTASSAILIHLEEAERLALAIKGKPSAHLELLRIAIKDVIIREKMRLKEIE